EAVFEPFHQLDMTNTRTNEGAGLGLAISMRLVEDLAGRIEVSDAPEGGARFRVEIPVDAVPAVFDTQAETQLDKRNIHIAMNEGAEKRLLEAMIADAGARVCPREVADTILVDMREAHEQVLERDEAAPDNARIIVLIEPQERGTFGARAKANGHGYLTRPVRESSLVRVLADEMVPVPKQSATAHEPAKQADKALRVLLIEDNEINAILANRLLTSQGHGVTLANSGSQALAIFEPGLFDIIITDLHMPETDGLQVISGIRRIEDDLGQSPVVIVGLTADESEETRRQFFDIGAQAVLTKPFEASQFKDIAERFSLL
ncbi:MAG: response regulator, partial [Pseudomonadota bacterium]